MRRCSLNSKHALNGLFAEDGVAQATGDVRELLVISPLDFPLVTLVVIVMARRRSILKSLRVVDLLRLREPGSGGLSPSVVEFKVDVVKVAENILSFPVGLLVVLRLDVALSLQVLRANLCDVQIDHVAVVTVDLHQLVLVIAVHIDVVAGADVLVGQDHLWHAILVARGLHVSDLHVTVFLALIHAVEEVLLGHDLLVGALCKLFSIDLVLELNEANLFLDNLVDPLANRCEVR